MPGTFFSKGMAEAREKLKEINLSPEELRVKSLVTTFGDRQNFINPIEEIKKLKR